MGTRAEKIPLQTFDYPVFNVRGKDEQDKPDSEDTPKEGTLNTIFQLAVPFGNISTVDLKERDVYLQESFEKLIEERSDLNLPYFLALTKDSAGTQQVVDATTFMRSYFKYNQKDSATTRQPIIEAQIYRIDSLKDKIFQPFCTLSQLTINKGHYAKIINACDPNLDRALRGQERFYVASAFEDGLDWQGKTLVRQNLDRAFFWYKKAAEDNYYGGHIALAEWYENGNCVVEQSNDKMIEHLTEAANYLPSTNKRIVLIYQTLATLHKNKENHDLSNHYEALANAKKSFFHI